MDSYINEIAKYLINNNVVFFIGAGFSREFGYPSWSELLFNIINKYNLIEELESSTLFIQFSEEEFKNNEEINKKIFDKLLGVDYLRLADYVDYLILKNNKDSMTTIKDAIVDEIRKCERERVNNKRIDGISKFFIEYSEYIEEIITTNYDTNIEFCFKNEVSVIHRGYDSLNNIEKRNKLYKIHGCVNDQNKNIIITERDYQNFILENKYLFYKIFSLLTEKKLVFLGYSINDPNIRDLLNEIKYESKNEVNIEVYWVNYDKVNELDKQYYSDVHKIKIVEDKNILDFLKDLKIRVDENLHIREINIENINEVVEDVIKNGNDLVYLNGIIEQIKEAGNEENIIKALYIKIIDDKNRSAIKAFVKLYMEVDDDIKRMLKLNLQNVLEEKNKTASNLSFILNNYNELQNYIIENGLMELYIKSAIEYCNLNHSFGEYGDAIYTGIMLAKLIDGRYEEYKDEVLEGLANNIKRSSKTRFIGYDWSGLVPLEKYVYRLSKDDCIKLLKLVSKSFAVPREEQLMIIINSYGFSEKEKKELVYRTINRKKLKIDIIKRIDEILYDCSIIENPWENHYEYGSEILEFNIKEEDSLKIEYEFIFNDSFKLEQSLEPNSSNVKFSIHTKDINKIVNEDEIEEIYKVFECWIRSEIEEEEEKSVGF